MFKLGRVSDTELAEIARKAEASEPTYNEVGATLGDGMPSGYRHDRYERLLSERADAFDVAVQGLNTWAAHTAAGLRVQPNEPPRLGLTVALVTAVGPLSAIALCRIVTMVEEADRFGFACFSCAVGAVIVAS